MSEVSIRLIREPLSYVAETKWVAFLRQHTHGNFFQSPDFLSIYKGCKNYKPLILFAENPKNEIIGTILALIINERIYHISFQRILILAGPVISASNPDRTIILNALLDGLKQNIPGETVFVEIRNLHAWGNDTKVFEQNGFTWHDHLNDLLPVNHETTVFTSIKPAKQRQIRRGLENGTIIRPATDISEVTELYSLLQDLYKTKVKKPLLPFLVFKNFYYLLQKEGKGVILVVKYKDKVIGGMVCPFSGENTVYEWYICSLRDELKQLYPGVLATWGGIDFAIRNKFQYFDFMGMGSPHQPYGVRDFKTQFGGEVVNFGRWQYVNNKPLYNLSLLGYKFLKWFF
ncbi:MAG: GNAT family N-acetyltransferase [Bacteroidales bacterium]|jgi:lipid II:glycine glycyltransferase (peptidoglycan interpeptide bridge formation enzyme)|nr:GNAT family N-acetyltransferase [Bacteroidales bacterium]